MKEPLSLGTVPPPVGRNFRWTIIAFALAGLLMAGLAVWQLAELSPNLYCKLVDDAGGAAGCKEILLKLLENKDNALIGTLLILGITVLSIVVVALGVNVKANGPGGLGVDVGTEKTRVTDGESEVVIPTPPSE